MDYEYIRNTPLMLEDSKGMLRFHVEDIRLKEEISMMKVNNTNGSDTYLMKDIKGKGIFEIFSGSSMVLIN